MSFFSFDTLTLEIIIKLIFAATLSLIIGFERELKRKPVGLKTSLVIATFSCLLTIISIETAYSTPARPDINITMDPLRLAAQIVSGVGFLGAGVILRKGNDNVTGLTTAAMIWGAAGLGIAVGAGFYLQATLAVGIVVIGIEFITPFVMRIGPKRLRQQELFIKIHVNDSMAIPLLIDFLKVNSLIIQQLKLIDATEHEVHAKLAMYEALNSLHVYESLHQLPYVHYIEIEFV